MEELQINGVSLRLLPKDDLVEEHVVHGTEDQITALVKVNIAGGDLSITVGNSPVTDDPAVVQAIVGGFFQGIGDIIQSDEMYEVLKENMT